MTKEQYELISLITLRDRLFSDLKANETLEEVVSLLNEKLQQPRYMNAYKKMVSFVGRHQ